MTELLINPTYNGPPGSGNGGYCCGRFAQSFEPDPLQALEVTLRKPPPLDTPLHAERVENGMEIRDPNDLIAQVRRTAVAFEPLAAPDPTLARQAESHYTGFTDHAFPNCFVCGPLRHRHDGLRLFPGALETRADTSRPVACHWQPYAALADEQGFLRPEFIWAALDCPTYFGAFVGEKNPTAVLGRQAVKCLQTRLRADQSYLVQSWLLETDGRKRCSAGALYTEAGECLALCRATWILIA